MKYNAGTELAKARLAHWKKHPEEKAKWIKKIKRGIAKRKRDEAGRFIKK